MREAGISPEFPMMVSHTIHSLTLEDIRYYFKSDATEDNGIPIGMKLLIITKCIIGFKNTLLCFYSEWCKKNWDYLKATRFWSLQQLNW